MNFFTRALFVLLISISIPTIADDQALYFGGGYAATTDDNYSDSDTSGYAIEAGFEINRNIAIDAKLSETSFDNYDNDLSMVYVGLDVGTDFGSQVFKLYGKLGYADASISYDGGSDSNIAVGAGVRFAVDGNQKGFYVKAEFLRVEFLQSYTTAMYAGFGYRF